MKFRAHDTFAIRKGWLHKGMRHVHENSRIFVDKNINQMDELGIGANMVKALRYWLQACGLTTEENNKNSREQLFTELGDLVWNNDPYMEEDGTFCLLHYKLASNENLATAWYFFFNKYNMSEITKSSFVMDIKQFISLQASEPISERSLEDDLDCILKTYVQTSDDKFDAENNIECPLTELGLIKVQDRKNKIYNKVAPSKGTLNPLIILAVIADQQEKNNMGNEIKISVLAKDPCNIGKIFNLDNMQIAYYLDKLQAKNYIKVIRAAGLDVIKITKDISFIDSVRKYYDELSN